MQPIPLRSTEPVKRIAIEEVRPLLPEDRSHGQVLDVTAALYGYDQWAHLHQSAKPAAPGFVFDQDMSYDEFSIRRVEVAKHVETVCAIPFPHAFALVAEAAVTRDFRRERAATFVPEHTAYQEEMAKLEWWRIGSIDSYHPLVTKGFALCQASYAADTANRVLGRPRPKMVDRRITVLLFEDMVSNSPYSRFDSSLFFKRNEILEVEPLPFAEMLESSYRPGNSDIAKLVELYDGREWAKRVVLAQKNYAELRAVSRLPASALEPIDVRARDVLRKPWCWPVKCRPGQTQLEYEYERLERAKWR